MHDSENKNMDSAVKIIITFACMVIKKKTEMDAFNIISQKRTKRW